MENISSEMNFYNWQNTVLGEVIALHSNEYFECGGRLSVFTKESKNNFIENLYSQISTILFSDNQIYALRARLSEHVIGYADCQVLCLKETDKAESCYSDCPYISGHLYKYLNRESHHKKDLNKLFLENNNLSNEELLSFLNTKCTLLSYYINGLNHIRYELKDRIAGKDWLRPFVKSMLIWSEYSYREYIGIETLLPDIDALAYSTFFNLVCSGSRDPLSEWQSQFEDLAI
ncbi:MAG: hypothetical protein WCK32_06470 [Chlorobiaceae bacterium]